MRRALSALDGSIAVMLTRFTIAKDATGRTVKAYGANQDITEQKRTAQQQDKLEEQLRLAQKMEALGTLAGGTAHEFNNMLGIILGYSELIRAELDNGHPCQSDLNEILKAGQRAKEIIQQILTFSRQQRQPREQVQLTDIVREALKLASHATLPATVAIHEEITGGDPFILANPTQIHQVLMNICINAWHAMDECGGGPFASPCEPCGRACMLETLHPNLRNGTYVHLSIADKRQRHGGGNAEPNSLSRFSPPRVAARAPVSGWRSSTALCRLPRRCRFRPKHTRRRSHLPPLFSSLCSERSSPEKNSKNGNQTRLEKRPSHPVGG